MELYLKVEEYFNDIVRPILVGDGGDIELLEVTEKKVLVTFTGACGSCPSSSGGTLRGIQNGVETIDPELVIVPIQSQDFLGPQSTTQHPFGGETYSETMKRKEKNNENNIQEQR